MPVLVVAAYLMVGLLVSCGCRRWWSDVIDEWFDETIYLFIVLLWCAIPIGAAVIVLCRCVLLLTRKAAGVPAPGITTER